MSNTVSGENMLKNLLRVLKDYFLFPGIYLFISREVGKMLYDVYFFAYVVILIIIAWSVLFLFGDKEYISELKKMRFECFFDILYRLSLYITWFFTRDPIILKFAIVISLYFVLLLVPLIVDWLKNNSFPNIFRIPPSRIKAEKGV